MGDTAADDPILTQAEAARRLGISRARLNAIVRSGKLATAPLEVAGIRTSDLEAYRARRKPAGRPRRADAEERN